MFYDAVKNSHSLKYDPFKALIAPRPIGWISSLSEDGTINLAPYSFFNAVSANPHYVFFSSYGRKDSLTNIEATGEFVCSIATYDLRDHMNKSSAGVPPEVDEMALADLTPEPSHFVKPPRVKEAPAALECKYFQTIELPRNDQSDDGYYMVLGQVVGIYIDDAVIKDGMLDMDKIRPLARLGYMDYTSVDNVFSLDRP
ncbi:MAG: flavin reductase family protein [Methyloligellaceae bacterium]